MVEEDSNSPETEFPGVFAAELTVLLTDTDDESDLLPELHIKEEKIKEIMQELHKELTWSACNDQSPPVSFPSPSTLPLAVSSTAVRSESCGPSVSDSASTVMAGIEFVGLAGEFDGRKVRSAPEINGLWPVEKEYCECDVLAPYGLGIDIDHDHGVGEIIRMDGCDGGVQFGGSDGDDQWLARVLGWAPLDIEEWT